MPRPVCRRASGCRDPPGLYLVRVPVVLPAEQPDQRQAMTAVAGMALQFLAGRCVERTVDVACDLVFVRTVRRPLRIVTDAGDVVVQERVAGTNWQPEARLDLRPGAEYFVLVDAYPEGDKAVSSHHVPFRITE